MSDDPIAMIRETRARLRAAGEPDTQRGVWRALGGSRHTISKYWHQTEPRTPGPTAAQPVAHQEVGARDTAAPRSSASPVATPPAVTLEALRHHYWADQLVSWPGVLPVEAYALLQQLWQAADGEIGAADRAKYITLNTLSDQRVRDIDAHPAMVAVETRRGTARLRQSVIQSDMETLRRNAHHRGIELPDPRLH